MSLLHILWSWKANHSERKRGLEAHLGRGNQDLMFPLWFWVGHLPAWFSCLEVVSDETPLKTLGFACGGAAGGLVDVFVRKFATLRVRGMWL